MKRLMNELVLTLVGVAVITLAMLDSHLHAQQLRRNDDPVLVKQDAGILLAQTPQETKQLAVRQAMQFVWTNYEQRAFGADALHPVTGDASVGQWGNVSCTLVDALDTLWLMDLKDEFKRARDYVATNLRYAYMGRDGKSVSVFETTIRDVGGLLSAFELSGDLVFRDKARELADLLSPAFNEDWGFFYAQFNPNTKTGSLSPWSPDQALLAEIGSLQLELRCLSAVTGDPSYARMGDRFYEILRREGSYNDTGLFPVFLDPFTGKFASDNKITVGGLGDSCYEYLLKVFVYSGQRPEDRFLRALYDEVVKGIERYLTVYSAQDDLYFLQQLALPDSTPIHEMEHLACFVPGMLALGTTFEKEDLSKNQRHLALAEKLMETCYQMYHRQNSGLAPDCVKFPGMSVLDPHHRLRPEVVESLFYMHRVTKDAKYRAYGWEIFQALETHARAAYGYGIVLDVTQEPVVVENEMESFFLAETLKYHYLLQSDGDLVPLDEFVFNTEAHPLRIRRTTAMASAI